MSEQCWLDSSNITFPLAAGSKLLTDDEHAAPDFDAVCEIFDEVNIGELELIEGGRTVSLANAHSQNDWASENEVKEMFNTLAPICPDGTYAELESTYADSDSRKYRLIVADDGVIEDFPNISWDPPGQIAQNTIARRASQIRQRATQNGREDSMTTAANEPFRLSPLDNPDQLCLRDLPINAVAPLMVQNQYPTTLSDGDPEQALCDNQALALRAATIVAEYAANRSPAESDALTVLRDFINDLHHLADALDITWDEAARDYHYRDQISHE